MPNAVSKVRAAFDALEERHMHGSGFTIKELREETGLKGSEVSMALCYLKRQRYAAVIQIDNPSPKGRGKVNLWRYYADKLR